MKKKDVIYNFPRYAAAALILAALKEGKRVEVVNPSRMQWERPVVFDGKIFGLNRIRFVSIDGDIYTIKQNF